MPSIDDVIDAWFDPPEISGDGVLNQFLPPQVDLEQYKRKVVRAISQALPGVPTSYLGGADQGHAWLLDTGDVIKLTLDEKEALASNTLASRKASHPNVVTFKDVHQLEELPIFIILQDFAGLPVKNRQVKALLDKIEEIEDPGRMVKIIRFLEPYTKRTDELGKAAKNLLDGMNWIMDQDINFSDLNPGNVVVDDGLYRIIDLGISKTNRPVQPEKLTFEERLDRALFRIKKIRI